MRLRWEEFASQPADYRVGYGLVKLLSGIAARESGMRGSDCPSEQDLAAFNLGELPEATLEVISRHLEGCPACEAFLDSLDDRTDTALAALRRTGPGGDRGRSRASSPEERSRSCDQVCFVC